MNKTELTNSQALCDIDWCAKRAPCNTSVAPTFSCFVLFSTGKLSPSFFNIPFDVGLRIPINWACQRFHIPSSHKGIFSSTGSLDRILKTKDVVESYYFAGLALACSTLEVFRT